VVCLRATEDPHHAGQQPVRTGAHVNRLDRQPQGIDPDHRSSSRIHAAHCDAASQGQLTLMTVALRLSSTWMSGDGA